MEINTIYCITLLFLLLFCFCCLAAIMITMNRQWKYFRERDESLSQRNDLLTDKYLPLKAHEIMNDYVDKSKTA